MNAVIESVFDRIEAAPDGVGSTDRGLTQAIDLTDWRAPMESTHLCSIPGCGQPHLCRGWCRSHYERWKFTGNPIRETHERPSAPGERWADVIGLEDRYQISTLGRVWSKPRIKPGTVRQEIGGYLLSHLIGSNGYPSVKLADGVGRYTRTVHVMILEAFVGPRPFPDWDACHNDGNRKNCRLDNLRWDTKAENAQDKIRHRTLTIIRKPTETEER